MMDPFRVIIMPRASSDLEKIYNNIAYDSVNNAAAMIGRIFAAIDSLADAPHRTVVEHHDQNLCDPARSLPVVRP